MSQDKTAADIPGPMPLALSLLGPFRATIGEAALPESRAKKIEALLIYLVLGSNQAHRRENLVGHDGDCTCRLR